MGNRSTTTRPVMETSLRFTIFFMYQVYLFYVPGAAISSYPEIELLLLCPLLKIRKIEIIGVVASDDIWIVVPDYGCKLI